MKTKFTQILMLLAITVGMGVIVTSCKDTNEDDFNKLRTEIQDSNTLIAALKSQVSNLQAQINELKARLDRINECECDMSDLQRTIAGLQADIANLKANKADKSEIARLENILSNLLDKYNYIEGLVIDNYVTKSVFESTIARLEKLIANAGGSETDISAILAKLSEIENGLIEAKALATTANALAENAKNTADAAKAAAALAQTAALAAQSDAAAAKNLANAVQKIANSNTERISTIETRLITMSVDLQSALTNANMANQRSKQDSIRINDLEKSLTALKNYLDKTQAEQDEKIKAQAADIAKQAADLKALQNELNALRSETETKLADVKKYADDQLKAAVSELNGIIDAKVADLNSAIDGVKGDVSELQTKVAALEALTTKLDELENKISECDGKLAALSEVIAQQVSGVIVQGTYNPAFGTFGVPVNIQSNVLVAYFGHAVNKVKFPVLDGSTVNYIRPEQVLTEDEANVINGVEQFTAAADDYLVSDEENNAGTLYLTINPAERDFEGLQLSLENSQAKTSGVKLGAARKSNKTLGFGWTRAAGENGFYEVPAYVKASGVKAVQKVNFNAEKTLNTLKGIYQDLRNRQTPSFTDFAKDIYDVLSGFNLDANAVKVVWATPDGEQHSVRSTYNIAATAVEPWNFGTLYGVERTHVPGYNFANSFLNRLVSSTKSKINKIFNKIDDIDVPEIKVEKVEFKGLSDETIAKFKTTVSIDPVELKKYNNVNIVLNDPEHAYVEIDGKKYPVIINAGADVDMSNIKIEIDDVTVDMTDVAKSINDDLNVDDLNDMIKDMSDFVDDVNDILASINDVESDVADAIENYVDRGKSYLEKIDGKLVGLFNSINSRLQPVMLGGVKGTTLLSTAEAYPTKWNLDMIDLIPTTWSYELAAPVCKKHVAIVNVSKGGVNYAAKAKAINSQNEELNKVLDGNDRFIRINGLEKGYTYTIAYSAMDYTGQIATHRCYVTVTE
ncbi:MAG: hypothetical protein K6F20_09790 [Bacteroidaceae bacterium]|nr:hypothetical protein [Bacteroidaceae bacterium]